MKLIRFLSIISLTTFLSLFIISDASSLENHVVPNGELGEFRHGTFPSPPIGDFTHVGVDIVAPCGSDIYAFADGIVKDIIDSANDRNFDSLGYMVLIEHPASLIGKKFYTLYLHMQRPPEVKIGNQVTGGRTVIGNVGSSGKTLGGCHTHFEIRYFPERFSVWGNIYCPDDQRYSEYFKQNWEDPLIFFKKYPNRLKLVKISGEPTKQSPVYVAKDSRAYHHDRNCFNITTTDGLMEFSSPQKAVASGGILCEYCASAVKETATPSYQSAEAKRSDVKAQRKEEAKILLVKDKPADDLKNFVIKSDDIPSGFTLDIKSQVDNRLHAKEWSLMTDRPDDWMRRFDEWGRIDGYRVEFVRSSNDLPVVIERIISSSSKYKSANGAGKAFRKMTENYQSEQLIKELLKSYGSTLLRFEIKENPSMGVESMMVYFKSSSQSSDIPFYMDNITILWRRDEILSNINFVFVNSLFFDSEVIKLAKVQDERIQQQKEKYSK